jgi:hypothetical protein
MYYYIKYNKYLKRKYFIIKQDSVLLLSLKDKYKKVDLIIF